MCVYIHIYIYVDGGYIGIIEKNMEATMVYWGYIRTMEKKVETTQVYWSYNDSLHAFTSCTGLASACAEVLQLDQVLGEARARGFLCKGNRIAFKNAVAQESRDEQHTVD